MFWIRVSVLALVLFTAVAVSAQDSYCLHRAVPVTIVDGDGIPVSTLIPSDLAASFRGKPFQVSALTALPQPRRVVIVIDASGSMITDTKTEFQTAVYVADQLVATNLSNASFAFYIFGDKAGERVEFADGNARAIERLRQILKDDAYVKDHVRGQTPLLDAINDAISMFGSVRPGDTILVISDGVDNSSHAKKSAVRKRILEDRIRLFACVFPSGMPPGVTLGGVNLAPDDFAGMAIDSGGSFLAPFGHRVPFSFKEFLSGHPDATLLAGLQLLDRQVVAGQNLEFTLPAPVIRPAHWQLSLTKERSKELKHAQILYPQELLPCSDEVASKTPSATPR